MAVTFGDERIRRESLVKDRMSSREIVGHCRLGTAVLLGGAAGGAKVAISSGEAVTSGALVVGGVAWALSQVAVAASNVSMFATLRHWPVEPFR